MNESMMKPVVVQFLIIIMSNTIGNKIDIKPPYVNRYDGRFNDLYNFIIVYIQICFYLFDVVNLCKSIRFFKRRDLIVNLNIIYIKMGWRLIGSDNVIKIDMHIWIKSSYFTTLWKSSSIQYCSNNFLNYVIIIYIIVTHRPPLVENLIKTTRLFG